MLTKSTLAIRLSKLKEFETPSSREEQYATPSEIAAEVLWLAFMQGDIEGKVIADLGTGNSILAVGASLLGAKTIVAVDKDDSALKIANQNINSLGIENIDLQKMDVSEFTSKCDTVLQNPPFGVQKKHADKEFLQKAFEVGKVVYSFHKSESRAFVEKMAAENGFILTNVFDFNFPIKQTQKFHRKKIHYFPVSCFRLQSRKAFK